MGPFFKRGLQRSGNLPKRVPEGPLLDPFSNPLPKRSPIIVVHLKKGGLLGPLLDPFWEIFKKVSIHRDSLEKKGPFGTPSGPLLGKFSRRYPFVVVHLKKGGLLGPLL